MLLHPGGSKDWRAQHFYVVFRHENPHRVRALLIQGHVTHFVEKLFKAAGLTHKDQLAVGRRGICPHMRDAAGQPDTPTRLQIVFLVGCAKKELARQNVIPLILAMVNVQEWPRAGQRVQLKNRASPSAVFAGYFAGGRFGLYGAAERKAILPRIGYRDLSSGSRPERQDGGDRRNPKRVQKRAAIKACHVGNPTPKNGKSQ
jgi:hypothetical protein